MTLNNTLVHVPQSGYVFTAAFGSTAPTDYATALDAAFGDLGYLSSNGLTENAPIVVKDITAHQNGDVVATISRVPKVEFGFGLIEHNKEGVVKFVHPGLTLSMDKKTATMGDHDGSVLCALVFAEVNANSMGVRTYFPRCKLTRRDQIGITIDNEKVYAVGVTAYKSGGFTWKKFYETALAT